MGVREKDGMRRGEMGGTEAEVQAMVQRMDAERKKQAASWGRSGEGSREESRPLDDVSVGSLVVDEEQPFEAREFEFDGV